MGLSGTIVCPQGASLIVDVDVCRDSVATELGKPFIMCSSQSWGGCTTAAIGCFEHNTKVLFQDDNSKSTTSAVYAPVCQKGNLLFQLVTECETFSHLRH